MSTDAHPSDYLLDRHRAGDLDHARAASVAAHLASCAACRARAAAFDRAAEALLAREAPEQFAARVLAAGPAPAASASQGGRSRRALAIVASLAAAAAVLVVASYGLRDAAEDPRLRTKGVAGVDLAFYVEQDGTGRPGLDGELLREGDRIRLAVTPGANRFVLVVSVADDGEVVSLYPEQPGASVRVPAAERALLAGSIILDDHRGDERLVALFSPEPLDFTDVAAALRRALDQARARGGGVRSLATLPLAAEQAAIWFRKE